jgi:hypothetical protein
VFKLFLIFAFLIEGFGIGLQSTDIQSLRQVRRNFAEITLFGTIRLIAIALRLCLSFALSPFAVAIELLNFL